MKLGFVILDEVAGVNSFKEIKEMELQPGVPSTLFFRLVQLPSGQLEPAGPFLRYVPQSGSSMTVFFDNLDSTLTLSRLAAQPFSADDRSIWSVPILATDRINVNSMRLQFTEAGITQDILGSSILSQAPAGNKRFFC